MSKSLIAYFSWGGNTKKIANLINEFLNTDLFEIKTVEKYPENYHDLAYGIAKEQKEKNIFPKIENNIDLSQYDTIYLGTPAWWYTLAPAVKTFLKDNDFLNKTIVPFITHGGGGGYTIDADMAQLASGAKVLKPLVVYNSGDSLTKENIKNWLSENNLG